MPRKLERLGKFAGVHVEELDWPNWFSVNHNEVSGASVIMRFPTLVDS